LRLRSETVSIGNEGEAERGLPETKEGKVGLRRAAAARASGTRAGVRQEIRGRAELVEGLTGGGLAGGGLAGGGLAGEELAGEGSDGASRTMTWALTRPCESRTCCD